MKTRLAFFAALVVLLAIAVVPVSAAKPLKIIKGPYLQQLTPDSIVIMWETNTAADSWVDYGGPIPVGNSTPVKIHEVLLDGLAADTEYYYTVTSGTKTSPSSTFWTAPATPRSFRFVAYGDTRTNANAHAAVIQGIIASGPEIVIHTGDLVENGDDYGQWGRQFFGPAYALMIDTPLLPIIGNHEGSGALFRDFFSLGDNDDWFAFTYGGVRFIGLNTHNPSYSPGSPQYTWLEEELQSPECTSADWQIVYFHHPPYSATSSHGDTQGVKDHLVPLFEAHGVDMVFSGHSHAYERYFNNGIHYIVAGGGGAPLTTLLDDPRREYGEAMYHHCVIDVDVDNSQLIFEARYNDGTPLDGPIVIEEPVDVTPPTASLLVPLDNGPDDLDADDGEVTVNTTQPVFDIQLSDVGDGIDVGTVISAAVTLIEQETGPVDYSFGYDAGLDVITLAPTGGGDFGNGLYVITLSGIADLAGNPMAATTLSILIDTSIVPPVTLSFQQGVGEYSAMVDTMIRWATANDNYADSATQHYGGYQYQYNADTDSSGGPCQILLRFDGIIGPDPGQIPSGSTIVSATLRIRSTDDGNGGKLHYMLQEWVDTVVTWNNSFGGDGIQADDSEANSVGDDGVPSNNPNTDVDLDVTATVQDWADGAVTNNGWAILPNGTNGWHIAAAEHPTLDWRPELIVTFTTTGKATNPIPTNGAVDVDVDAALSWTAGAGTETHDVYFGDDSQNLPRVSTGQSSTTYDPGTMNYETPYYWRIDEVGPAGVAEGEVWSFTTVQPPLLGQATNPSPEDGAVAVPVEAVLSWDAGEGVGEVSHNVYFGTTSPPAFIQNQTETTYDPLGAAEDLEPGITYYWRIDEIDSEMTVHTGLIWSFTTYIQAPGDAIPNAPINPDWTAVDVCDVGVFVILRWLSGDRAASHDVYFGVGYDDVNDATNASPEFKGNIPQEDGTYYPVPDVTVFEWDPLGTEALPYDSPYWWRIDEINPGGVTKGEIWNFTTESDIYPPHFDYAPQVDPNTVTAHEATITWTTNELSDSLVEYSLDTSYESSVYDGTLVTFHSVTLTGLQPDTTYYYRVTSTDNAGNSATEENPSYYNFTTLVAGDVVTIIKAEYVIGKSELKVEATSSEGGTAVLTVVGYGTMTYDSRKNKYVFREKPMADPGGTVTVTSSLGGSDTASVTHK